MSFIILTGSAVTGFVTSYTVWPFFSYSLYAYPEKNQKSYASFAIELKKTTDILASLGKLKTSKQLLIGFALETEKEEDYAKEKLQKKNLDLIVLNSLNDKGAGFKTETNKITIFNRILEKTTFELKSKQEVAKDICNEILKLVN